MGNPFRRFKFGAFILERAVGIILQELGEETEWGLRETRESEEARIVQALVRDDGLTQVEAAQLCLWNCHQPVHVVIAVFSQAPIRGSAVLDTAPLFAWFDQAECPELDHNLVVVARFDFRVVVSGYFDLVPFDDPVSQDLTDVVVGSLADHAGSYDCEDLVPRHRR